MNPLRSDPVNPVLSNIVLALVEESIAPKGKNCWRRLHADRVAFLVDAACRRGVLPNGLLDPTKPQTSPNFSIDSPRRYRDTLISLFEGRIRGCRFRTINVVRHSRRPFHSRGRRRRLHACRTQVDPAGWKGSFKRTLVVVLVSVLMVASSAAAATFARSSTVVPAAAPASDDSNFELRTLRVLKLVFIRLPIIPKTAISLPPAARFISIVGADSTGKLLDGGSCYLLHFAPADVPPRGTNWSLALYETDLFRGPTVFGTEWLGSDRPPRYNVDGSFDVVIQQRRPGAATVANWLSAPAGPFNLVVRLSSRGAHSTDLDWQVPSPRRVEARAAGR
jgi:hypothetical protein